MELLWERIRLATCLRDTLCNYPTCWIFCNHGKKRLSERLSEIESTLVNRFLLAESSLEQAHSTISDLKSDLSGIKTELAEVRAEKRKSDIISELRSKKFNLLFHGLLVCLQFLPMRLLNRVKMLFFHFWPPLCDFPSLILPRFHLPMSIVCQSILQHFSQVAQVVLSLRQ